ncbi:hypothetical protein ACTXT7_000225 [Hymenolepis weldensis]
MHLPANLTAKSTISFLQKARDALVKDHDVYKLDNSRLVDKNKIEPAIKQIDLLSAPRNNVEDDGEFDDGYLKDFQNFINNLERRQMSFNSAKNSSLSLRLQSSPHFPATDRSEEDRIEAYTPNSIVPSHRKAVLGKTSSLTNFSIQNRNSFMEPLTNGGLNLQKTPSLSAHRRRVPSANENPAASSLGGLIGRRKATSSDSSYLNPVTSFSQLRTGTLARRQQQQQESPIDQKSQVELAQLIEKPECLAKPVVFLEYGDL